MILSIRHGQVERGPEKSVQRVQYRVRPFAFQNRDVLAEGEDFQRRVAPTAEEDADHRQHGEDEFAHRFIPFNTPWPRQGHHARNPNY
jgi:hypothetical protein